MSRGPSLSFECKSVCVVVEGGRVFVDVRGEDEVVGIENVGFGRGPSKGFLVMT